MDWAHLPNGGGLFDQNPLLLDHWVSILHQRGKHQEAERKREERKKSKSPGPGRRR